MLKWQCLYLFGRVCIKITKIDQKCESYSRKISGFFFMKHGVHTNTHQLCCRLASTKWGHVLYAFSSISMIVKLHWTLHIMSSNVTYIYLLIKLTCCFARYIRAKMMRDEPLVTNASGGTVYIVMNWLYFIACLVSHQGSTFTFFVVDRGLLVVVIAAVSYELLLQQHIQCDPSQWRSRSFIKLMSVDCLNVPANSVFEFSRYIWSTHLNILFLNI